MPGVGRAGGTAVVTAIYVVHWQPFVEFAQDGGAIRHFVCGQDDRVGDGIPDIKSHSEMRCHYWVWRNADLRRLGHVGFHHYRRAFLYERWTGPGAALTDFGWLAAETNRRYAEQYTRVPADLFLSYRQALAAIQDWSTWLPDLMLPRPLDLREGGGNLGGQYRMAHRTSDWRAFEDAAKAEGLDLDLPFLHCFNMFVARADLFEEYMALWWRVMGAVAERIVLPTHGYQSRVFGFLSERLFTAWQHRLRCRAPRLRIETAPVLYCPTAEGGPGEALAAQG